MSADLFAEFNSPPSQPTPRSQTQTQEPTAWSGAQSGAPVGDPFDFFALGQAGNQKPPNPTSQPQPQPQVPSIQEQPVDDDGWGDFETAQAPKPQPPSSFQPRPLNRTVRASTLDIMTNTLVDVERMHSPGSASWNKSHVKSGPSDPNVLFDADDFELQGGEYAAGDDDEDDDDFGEFETGEPEPAAAPSKPANLLPSMELLSLDDEQSWPSPTRAEPPKPQRQIPAQLKTAHLSFGATGPGYPHAPKSPSYQERTPYPDLAIRTPVSAEPITATKDPGSPTPVTVWPTVDRDKPPSSKVKDDTDEWADWGDAPSITQDNTDIDSTLPPESWAWDAADGVQPAKPAIDESAPPPVNVPPPSVILSAFIEIFSTGNALFQPIRGQSMSIKDRVLSDPKATTFLQGYVLIGATAARVIAGRKQRWHRDKILAKSMSISAAGSKGMKLAGVDKTQSAREDREAEDVVAAWRENVGRLRSAVAAANTSGKLATAPLKVPELSANLQIQTAKGAPTAPKPCVICGLKREERVAKVDVDVEDSFGEWWAEHWGHRACKNFWVEHEGKLRQR